MSWGVVSERVLVSVAPDGLPAGRRSWILRTWLPLGKD
jgi:hypothetical protein